MKRTKSFDGLRQHRKRLLTPLSAIRVGKNRVPFTSVSWADDGAAELLWLCCLIHRYGLERCIPLVAAIAEIATHREMKARHCFLFLSQLATISSKELDDVVKNLADAEVATSFRKVFAFFAAIFYKEDRRTISVDAGIVDELRTIVRVATNKESRLALKAMALFLLCEVRSESLLMPPSSAINPMSLDDYPHTAESKITAGLLRAYINGILGPGDYRTSKPFCEKLWPTLVTMEGCNEQRL